MKTYIVTYSKYFVSGNLQGIMVDCTLSFPTLELASEFVGWTIEHATKPVEAFGSPFTTHMGTIK